MMADVCRVGLTTAPNLLAVHESCSGRRGILSGHSRTSPHSGQRQESPRGSSTSVTRQRSQFGGARSARSSSIIGHVSPRRCSSLPSSTAHGQGWAFKMPDPRSSLDNTLRGRTHSRLRSPVPMPVCLMLPATRDRLRLLRAAFPRGSGVSRVVWRCRNGRFRSDSDRLGGARSPPFSPSRAHRIRPALPVWRVVVGGVRRWPCHLLRRVHVRNVGGQS